MFNIVCLGLKLLLTSEVISRRCLLVACAATPECHAADKGHDTPPSNSIQIQGRPVAVLSFDVERYTGIHSYPF